MIEMCGKYVLLILLIVFVENIFTREILITDRNRSPVLLSRPWGYRPITKIWNDTHGNIIIDTRSKRSTEELKPNSLDLASSPKEIVKKNDVHKGIRTPKVPVKVYKPNLTPKVPLKEYKPNIVGNKAFITKSPNILPKMIPFKLNDKLTYQTFRKLVSFPNRNNDKRKHIANDDNEDKVKTINVGEENGNHNDNDQQSNDDHKNNDILHSTETATDKTISNQNCDDKSIDKESNKIDKILNVKPLENVKSLILEEKCIEDKLDDILKKVVSNIDNLNIQKYVPNAIQNATITNKSEDDQILNNKDKSETSNLVNKENGNSNEEEEEDLNSLTLDAGDPGSFDSDELENSEEKPIQREEEEEEESNDKPSEEKAKKEVKETSRTEEKEGKLTGQTRRQEDSDESTLPSDTEDNDKNEDIIVIKNKKYEESYGDLDFNTQSLGTAVLKAELHTPENGLTTLENVNPGDNSRMLEITNDIDELTSKINLATKPEKTGTEHFDNATHNSEYTNISLGQNDSNITNQITNLIKTLKNVIIAMKEREKNRKIKMINPNIGSQKANNNFGKGNVEIPLKNTVNPHAYGYNTNNINYPYTPYFYNSFYGTPNYYPPFYQYQTQNSNQNQNLLPENLLNGHQDIALPNYYINPTNPYQTYSTNTDSINISIPNTMNTENILPIAQNNVYTPNSSSQKNYQLYQNVLPEANMQYSIPFADYGFTNGLINLPVTDYGKFYSKINSDIPMNIKLSSDQNTAPYYPTATNVNTDWYNSYNNPIKDSLPNLKLKDILTNQRNGPSLRTQNMNLNRITKTNDVIKQLNGSPQVNSYVKANVKQNGNANKFNEKLRKCWTNTEIHIKPGNVRGQSNISKNKRG